MTYNQPLHSTVLMNNFEKTSTAWPVLCALPIFLGVTLPNPLFQKQSKIAKCPPLSPPKNW